MDHLNEDVLHPLLQDLVKTPFFRYFKVRKDVPTFVDYLFYYYFVVSIKCAFLDLEIFLIVCAGTSSLSMSP